MRAGFKTVLDPEDPVLSKVSPHSLTHPRPEGRPRPRDAGRLQGLVFAIALSCLALGLWQLVFVAGVKVRTDLFTIPFSKGLNLICIHSKKYIEDDPATKPLKTQENMAAMKASRLSNSVT